MDPLRVHQVKVDSRTTTTITTTSSHCDFPDIAEPVRPRRVFSLRQLLVLCCPAASAYNSAPETILYDESSLGISLYANFQDLNTQNRFFFLLAACFFAASSVLRFNSALLLSAFSSAVSSRCSMIGDFSLVGLLIGGDEGGCTLGDCVARVRSTTDCDPSGTCELLPAPLFPLPPILKFLLVLFSVVSASTLTCDEGGSWTGRSSVIGVVSMVSSSGGEDSTATCLALPPIRKPFGFARSSGPRSGFEGRASSGVEDLARGGEGRTFRFNFWPWLFGGASKSSSSSVASSSLEKDPP
jgi:hypothetical protein